MCEWYNRRVWKFATVFPPTSNFTLSVSRSHKYFATFRLGAPFTSWGWKRGNSQVEYKNYLLYTHSLSSSCEGGAVIIKWFPPSCSSHNAQSDLWMLYEHENYRKDNKWWNENQLHEYGMRLGSSELHILLLSCVDIWLRICFLIRTYHRPDHQSVNYEFHTGRYWSVEATH